MDGRVVRGTERERERERDIEYKAAGASSSYLNGRSDRRLVGVVIRTPLSAISKTKHMMRIRKFLRSSSYYM